MVRVYISKCQASGIIRILACLTTLFLLNIYTVHCSTSPQSIISKGPQTSALDTNVTATITRSGTPGKIIILMLFNRRLKLIC